MTRVKGRCLVGWRHKSAYGCRGRWSWWGVDAEDAERGGACETSQATGKGESQSLEQIWASLKVEVPPSHSRGCSEGARGPDVSV